MIKLCVFDLAGTTIRDDGGAVADAFQRAFALHGCEVSQEIINKYMGLAKPLAISKIASDELGAKISEYIQVRIHRSFVALMQDHYRNTQDLAMPGAEDCFRQLHAWGIKVALDTGFSQEITQLIQAKLGWVKNNLIDAVCSSDQVSQGRPSPDMIKKIMADLGIEDASSVAKIGDTPADIQEGLNAGCGLVVGVLSGTYSREKLEKTGVSIIDSISYLPELIDFQ
jgi:phosphonatase-like hydrolase